MDPNSIVDFLKSKNQDSSYEARAKLATEKGITGYTGTAEQNTQLLGMLSSEKPKTEGNPTLSAVTGAGTTPTVITSESIRVAEQNKKDEQAKKDAEAKAELDRLTTQKAINDIKAGVAPTGGAPEVPKLTETYKGLLGEKDTTGQSYNDLQSKIGELNKQKEESFAQLKTFKRNLPEGVTAGFAQGTISKEERDVQDKIDTINREINAASLQLNNRANVINSIMGLTKEEYSNASARYDKEFSQNLQLLNSVEGSRNREEDNARATSQVLLSSLQESGLTYADLAPDQKVMLSELSMQAGLGKDFYPTVLAKSASKPILTQIISDDKTTATILYKDGTTKKFSTGLAPQDGGKDTEKDVVKDFNKSVSTGLKRGDEKSREQFIRELRAQYPQIDGNDIARKVYEVYPDGWDD